MTKIRYFYIFYRTLQQLSLMSFAPQKFAQLPCLYYWRYEINMKSRDSSVGIALGYELDDRGSRVRFPVGGGNFSLHHRVQIGSGAHPASYPMGTRGSFPGSKAAVAWSWPLTSIYCRGRRMRGVIPPLPQYAFMAWCLVKHRDNFVIIGNEYEKEWNGL
jgi:hypothetical protein